MRLRIFLVAVLVAAVAPISGTSAHHADPHPCGSQKRMGAGWYDVVAHGVGCKTARRVARTYTFEGEDAVGDVKPGGWKCRTIRRTGYESSRHGCHTEGDRWIRFSTGA